MRTNPMVTLQIQNKALMRKVLEVQAEIEKLKHELEDIQREADKKELKSTPTK
jgi:predicted RNase H-like nuclease (RuvC/YqgF family)